MSRLVVSQVAALTRRLGRVSLLQTAPLSSVAAASARIDTTTLLPSSKQQPLSLVPLSRSFASKKDSKKADKQQPANKKKPEEPASKQHEEWVKFQQSIQVDSHETGQTLTLQSPHKKKRGGKSARRSQQSAAEEKLAERQRLTAFGGGEYPPERYSDEETERLLAEAYAAIPQRAGKRGTRNLKRQKLRWHLVRKGRKKYKKQLARHQERKMQERSDKIKRVKAVLAQAPATVQRDREYQLEVYQRWSLNMMQNEQTEQQQNESADAS